MTMLNQKLIDEEFAFLKDAIFLNVSQVSMPPKRVQDAYRSFMDNYVATYGMGMVPAAWDMVAETRELVAKLVNCEAEEVGFVKNTAEGMSILACGYPLKAGDSIVIADQEHQSVLFPWINMHEKIGLRLNVVKSIEGNIRTQDMIDAIDEDTKILVVSSAQFSTGFRADLETLGKECKKRGIIFAVDGIQTLGRYVMDVKKFNIDYLVAGTNKGLFGTLGAGLVYCSNRIVQKIIPPYAGYQSTMSHVAPPSITTNFENLEWYPNARRFESGNLSYNCIYAINKGISLLLELGVENIQEQIEMLEETLRDQISDLKLHVVSPEPALHRSGIVCVYYPANKDDEADKILKDKKIYCTMRGGYIRIGLDFYNTPQQMATVAAALHEIAALQ